MLRFYRHFILAPFHNLAKVGVILVLLVIPAGFRPPNRLGSHEREITDIGAGNNSGNNRTTLRPVNLILLSQPILHS